MRLIDADALMKKVHDIEVKQYPDGAIYRHRCVDMFDIRDAPTVDPSKTEYQAKVSELELAIFLCKQAEKEFKSRTCKFKSPTNCNFCAFHSDCDEHWKEGNKNET